jgi:hypothetical protein
MTGREDQLFGQLAALSVHDVDSWRGQKTRKQAHKLLARQRRLKTIAKAWSSYLEPALVGSGALAYLVWALQQVYFLKS